MRWIKLTGLIPVALVCLFTACNTEYDTLQSIAENEPTISQINSIVTEGIEVLHGLLSIKDGITFDQLVDQLDAADGKWNDEFLLEVTGLTLENLDGKPLETLDEIAEMLEREEAARGITGDLIYENFENGWGYSSLRALLVQLEDQFLENSSPDWENNPDDHYVTGTAERTLLNKEGAIMVGGILYKFMPNGIIYEITNGDFNTLWDIGPEHAETIYEAPNVKVYNTEVLNTRRACRTWVRKKYSREYVPKRYKYKGITGHRSLLFTNRVYSTVKHYKKKNGRWKRRRAYLKTNNWGRHGIGEPGSLNATCKQQVNYNSGLRSRFRRRLTSRHETFGLGFGKIESGEVQSFHESNGDRAYYILEF